MWTKQRGFILQNTYIIGGNLQRSYSQELASKNSLRASMLVLLESLNSTLKETKVLPREIQKHLLEVHCLAMFQNSCPHRSCKKQNIMPENSTTSANTMLAVQSPLPHFYFVSWTILFLQCYVPGIPRCLCLEMPSKGAAKSVWLQRKCSMPVVSQSL